jgi:type VI secretion system protein VasJ
MNVFEKLLQPIGEQHTVGVDSRYDDSYLQIEAECAKMESINDEKPDWSLLISYCEEFLKGKSKDLKVLSWWLYSIYKEKEFPEFLNAFSTYNRFLELYSNDMFPKSLNQKIKIFQWIDILFEKEIIQNNTLNIQKEYYEKLFIEIKKSKSYYASLSKDNTNIFKNIQRLLSEAINTKNKEVQNKKDKVPTTAKETIDDDRQALKVLNEIKRKSLNLHNYWSVNDPSDIKALRISRMTAWLDIDEEPINDNGKTKINPPSYERIEKVEDFLKSQEKIPALALLEEMLLRMPFWLEGHYKVYCILKSIDKNDAAQEVKSLLNWFLQSNPWLHNLAFNDGSKFVTKEVKEMISFDNDVEELNNTEDDLLESIKQKVYPLVKKNKIGEAMHLLHDAYMLSKDESQRFFLRLFHTQIAIENGKNSMALSFVNELEKKIDIHNLETWQPSLAAQVYLLMLKSFNKNFIEREKLNEIYQKLCLIAPAEAVNIKL